MASVPINKLDSMPMMILYAIQAADGVPLGKTHFQKIMFQTLKILDIDPDDAGYRAHHYGPFSNYIEEHKESLELIGYLDEKGGKIKIPESEKRNVAEIKPPSEDKGFRIKVMIGDLSKLTNDEMLLMIYHDDIEETGGKYLENSEVKEDIMRRRMPIAVKMYRGKKISLGRATELAGIGLREFEEILIKKFGAVYVD